MGTDSWGAAYATHAGSVSDEVDRLDTNMPMDDLGKDLWEQQVAPQMLQPPLKVTVSKSGGISHNPSTP